MAWELRGSARAKNADVLAYHGYASLSYGLVGKRLTLHIYLPMEHGEPSLPETADHGFAEYMAAGVYRSRVVETVA